MEIGWLILALLSAVTASLVAIFGKIGLEGVDSNTATMIRAGIMFFVLVLVILFTGKLSEISSVAADRSALFYIILSGIAGALSWLFYFGALKIGEASRVASIDRLSIVFVVILAALVLAEKVTPKIAAGISMMVVGAILVALG
jgi:transporter family protein